MKEKMPYNGIALLFLVVIFAGCPFTGGKYSYANYKMETDYLINDSNTDFLVGGWYNGTGNASIGYFSIYNSEFIEQINVTGPTDTGGSMVRDVTFNNLTGDFIYVAYGYYNDQTIRSNESVIKRYNFSSDYELTENLSFYFETDDVVDSITIHDFDDDGYPEIVSAGAYPIDTTLAGAVWLHTINSSLTNFTETSRYNTAPATVVAVPKVGDFYGDGNELIVTMSYINNTTTVMPIFNVTPAMELDRIINFTFTQLWNPQLGDVEIVDYDNDGDDEFAFIGFYCVGGGCPDDPDEDTNFYGFLGLADFNETTGQPYMKYFENGIQISNNRTTLIYDLDVTDIDNDGDYDYVISGSYANWTHAGIQGWWELWPEQQGNMYPFVKVYGLEEDGFQEGYSNRSTTLLTNYTNMTAYDVGFQVLDGSYTERALIGMGSNTALTMTTSFIAPYMDNTWYSVDYRYRRRLTVIEDLGIDRTDDQFTFLLDVGDTSSINCSDGILVLDPTETSEYPINLSVTYNATHCKVRIPFNISANNYKVIHVYYGNPQSSTFTPYSGSWGTDGETIKRGQAYVTGTGCTSSGSKHWFTGYCPNFNMFDGVDDGSATVGVAPSDEGYLDAIADYNYSGNTGYNIWQLRLSYYVYGNPAVGVRTTNFWHWFYNWSDSSWDTCASGSLAETETEATNCTFTSSTTFDVMDYINETSETYRYRIGVTGDSPDYGSQIKADVYDITVSYNLIDYDWGEVDSHLEPARMVYDSPIVEGSNQTYQLKINQSDFIDNVTAIIILNGTSHTPTYYNDSVDHIFEYNHSWPLSGDVNVTVYWDYNVTMGENVEETNTTLDTIEIYESPDYYNDPNVSYELQNVTYFFTINVSDNANVDAVLLWNSTEYTPTESSVTGQFNFTYNFTTPTISENNTSIEWNWLYNITSLGEVVERNTSENLTLIYAVYPHTANWTPSFIIEGRPIYFNTTILDLNHLEDSITVTYHIWNNTTGTADFVSRTGNYSLFEFNETAEFIDDLNETSYLNITASFNPNRTVSWNLTSYGAYLTNCSAGSASQNKTLTFYIRDESNGSLISDELKISVTLTDPELAPFGFEFSNNSTYSICIFPENASYPNTEIELEYGADGYAQRIWSGIRTLTNVNQDIDLYLLDENDGQSVVFQVRDLSTNLLVPGLIIYIQRRYFELGAEQYLTVATVITGVDGKGKAFVDTDAIYKFIVMDENDSIFEYAPTQITSDPTELQIGYSMFGGWNEVNNILSNCYFTGSDNKTVSCTAIDSTGAEVDVCLEVYDYSSWYREEICNTCGSGTGAVTLVCNATNATSSIQYTFTYEYNTFSQILEQGIRDLSYSASPLGVDGAMVAFFAVITLGIIGTMIHPIVGFVLGILTFLMLDLMNIFDMPPQVYGPLVLIFAIVSVAMAKKEGIL